MLINFSFLRFRHRLKKDRLNVDTMVFLMIVTSIGGLLMSFYTRSIGNLYRYFQDMGMEPLFGGAVFWMFNVFLLLVGSFFILHLFCFSRDSIGLFYLPLRSEVLLFSKLLVAILLGYVLAFLLLVPPFILYALDHFSAGLLAAAFVLILLSPIMPLTVLGGIALLALKWSAVWKKNPGWMAAAGYLLLLAFTGGMTGRLLGGATPENGLALLSRLEAHHYGLMFLLYFGLSGAALYLFWHMGRRLFPDGLTLFVQEGRTKPAKNPQRIFAKRHPLLSCFYKEWRLFFREPIYVLNGMFGVVLPPFLLPLAFRFSASGSELEGIRRMVIQERFSFMATVLALAIVVITSGFNVVASSSVSREGSHFWLCRLIPLPYEKQILTKAAFATVASGIGLLLNCFIFMLYFGYRLHQILIVGIIGLLFCLAWSALGILIDVLHPKLDWVNRSEAVKQNINVILAILLNALVIGLYYVWLNFALSNNWNEKLILAGIAASVSLLSAAALQGIIMVCRRQERNRAQIP